MLVFLGGLLIYDITLPKFNSSVLESYLNPIGIYYK